MKNYLALLFVVIPLFVFSQNCSHLTFTVSGDTLTLPYSSISKLVPFGNECYIQTFDMEFNEISDESYASIVAADDCNCLIEITFENGNNIAIPKKSVYRVSEGFGGSTLVESTNGTQRVGYSVQEAVSDIATNLSSCGGGGSINPDTLTFNIAENYGAVADANGNLVQGNIWVSPTFLNGGVRIGGQAGNESMGIYNTAIGFTALRKAASTARENVAIGYQALEEVEQDNNIAIGAQSLNELTTGSNNVAIGYRAGYNQYLTNNDNTIIGSNSTVAGNSSTNELVIGANLVGQGDSTVNIGYDPTDKYLKAYLPDTIQTEIITNAAGDVIDVSASGGSNKMTFTYNQGFYNATVPPGTGYLPITSSSFSGSHQRYNGMQVPYGCRLKRVSITHMGIINNGDYTLELLERPTSGSTLVSVESQTVNYTEDVSNTSLDTTFNFDFTTSAIVGPDQVVWLQYSTTNTTQAYGNTLFTIVFEEL